MINVTVSELKSSDIKANFVLWLHLINVHPCGLFGRHFYACQLPRVLLPSIFACSLHLKGKDEPVPVFDADP
jgi:hypothetical protein